VITGGNLEPCTGWAAGPPPPRLTLRINPPPLGWESAITGRTPAIERRVYLATVQVPNDFSSARWVITLGSRNYLISR